MTTRPLTRLPSSVSGVSDPVEPEDVDPEEFLRRLLAISPEDAAEVREDTPGGRRPQREDDQPRPDDAE